MAREPEPVDQERAKRLRQARLTCGNHNYRNATTAASVLNIPAGTYLSHENGWRGFSHKKAERYAKFYTVNIAWLQHGIGPMRSEETRNVRRA